MFLRKNSLTGVEVKSVLALICPYLPPPVQRAQCDTVFGCAHHMIILLARSSERLT